jgi:hypothetical protein
MAEDSLEKKLSTTQPKLPTTELPAMRMILDAVAERTETFNDSHTDVTKPVYSPKYHRHLRDEHTDYTTTHTINERDVDVTITKLPNGRESRHADDSSETYNDSQQWDDHTDMTK